MALEGYIAVCFPLRHAQICSVRKTYLVIGLIWVMSWLAALWCLCGAWDLEPLGFFLSRVFCVGDRVFRNPLLKEKRDVSYIIFLVLVWFILFYTYFKILFAAKGASADAKKARNTVVLHGFQLLRACSRTGGPCLWKVCPLSFRKGLYLLASHCSSSSRSCLCSSAQLIYGLRDRTFRKLLLKVLPGSSMEGPSMLRMIKR